MQSIELLLNYILKKHADGAWEKPQTQQFASIVLCNLSLKPEEIDNCKYKKDMQVAVQMYLWLKKQRIIFRLVGNNLTDFHHVILRKLQQNDLSVQEIDTVIQILTGYQSNLDMIKASKCRPVTKSTPPIIPDKLVEQVQINAEMRLQKGVMQSIAAVIVPVDEAAQSAKKEEVQIDVAVQPQEVVAQFMPAVIAPINEPPIYISMLFGKKVKQQDNLLSKAPECITIPLIKESKALSPIKPQTQSQPKQKLPKLGDLAYAAALLFKQKKQEKAAALFRFLNGAGIAESNITFVADIFKSDTRRRSNAAVKR